MWRLHVTFCSSLKSCQMFNAKAAHLLIRGTLFSLLVVTVRQQKIYSYYKWSIWKGKQSNELRYIWCLLPFLSSQDVFYHFLALLFYFSAFTLEAAVTSANRGASFQLMPNGTVCTTYPPGNIFTLLDYRQYSINVAATVSRMASMTEGVLCRHVFNIVLKFSFLFWQIFAFVTTLCYGCSLVMGLKRQRM